MLRNDKTSEPHDGSASETRSGRAAPPAISGVRVLTPGASEQRARVAPQPAPVPTRRSLDEIRAEATAVMREVAAREERRPDPLNRAQITRANQASFAAEDRVTANLRADNARLRREVARQGLAPATRSAPARRGPDMAQVQRQALYQYMRTGQETFNTPAGPMHLRDIERQLNLRNLHSGSSPDGGFLVMPEHDTGPIEKILQEMVVMRQIATVRTIGGYSLKKPFNKRGATASWVGEQEARGETSTPDLAELEFPAMELYAKPLASATMLEDSSIDLEGWLAEEVNEAFADAEELGYFAGAGNKQPQGLLTLEKVATGTWGASTHFMKFEYLPSGTDAAITADSMTKLPYLMKPMHRANGSYMLNRGTIGAARILKDGNGTYVWSDAKEGNPARLFNFPVIEAESMPDIASDSFPVGFGDWKRTYIIVDRVGMSVLRDPYSSKPYIEFYTRKRVGGGVQNHETAKFLKCATS